MKYLGIDYGKRKIGLAISEGEIATPDKVIQISALKDAIAKIRVIVDREKVDQVVVGMPDGGEIRKITEQFIKELKNVTQRRCNIVETEETLTSKNAKQQMIGLGIAQKERQTEDAYAAALILQNYLDAHK